MLFERLLSLLLKEIICVFSEIKPRKKKHTGEELSHCNIATMFKFNLITEKDHGFLRIGSLNVRVRRTTEAFSQFLGVATNSNSSNNSSHNDKIHNSWGSADNVQVIFSFGLLRSFLCLHGL